MTEEEVRRGQSLLDTLVKYKELCERGRAVCKALRDAAANPPISMRPNVQIVFRTVGEDFIIPINFKKQLEIAEDLTRQIEEELDNCRTQLAEL